jgi:hypothetical protein
MSLLRWLVRPVALQWFPHVLFTHNIQTNGTHRSQLGDVCVNVGAIVIPRRLPKGRSGGVENYSGLTGGHQ